MKTAYRKIVEFLSAILQYFEQLQSETQAQSNTNIYLICNATKNIYAVCNARHGTVYILHTKIKDKYT